MTLNTWKWAAVCAATLAVVGCNTGTDDKDDTDTDTDTMDTDTDTMDTDTDTMDSDSDIAETFDLTFSGTGYDPHDGQTIYVSVRDSADAEIGADSVVVAGGTFTFTWADALTEGQTYTIDYYADLNTNSACDAPPTDHAWRVAIPAVQDNVVQAETHNTNFTDVCASF